MNDVLLTAVVVVGALGCLNLLLLFGVIRRLRALTEQLAVSAPADSLGPARPSVGERLPSFTARTLTGEPITEDFAASGETYLGFFSTGCAPCVEHLPRFVELVAAAGPDRVLVVIDDDGRDLAERARFIELAERAGRVVVESPMGPVSSAMGVDRLPTMVSVRDGVVSANVQDIQQFTAPTLTRT
ncbi:TlpA family protein disulfide reductase [Micromonospora profundi]|uniref:TlpA family protein disulfide reductase n=1 Tax=Micromonospora profundi TaxID=1420889 RepID=UPI00365A3CFD